MTKTEMLAALDNMTPPCTRNERVLREIVTVLVNRTYKKKKTAKKVNAHTDPPE